MTEPKTMSEMTRSIAIRTLLAAVLVTHLTACAEPVTKPESPAAAGATDESNAAENEVEPWAGDGMDIPLDGTSLEAFNASLARVKHYSKPEDYETLVNAIDYLMVYDLSAHHDRTKLAANLNGLTGYQVIEKVQWRKPKPGKSPAEKGAADATIDT
jgi:hypothetical protein